MLFHRFRRSILTICLTAVLLAVVSTGGYELRWALSHRTEKLSIGGVDNFGRMNRHLYRGAQPTAQGFVNLRQLGVDTVVRLSLGQEGSTAERAVVESLGMHFVNLPWSSVHLPQTGQVVEFLSLVKEHPERTYFVHCKAGADRTGVFVALYRIVLDRWTTHQAVDEMKAFHYRTLFLPHLQTYVEKFPARLESEPAFVQFESANVF